MSRAQSPLRDRMIFNVGARRSGTFWLQRIVTSHPQIAGVPSETSLFSGAIAPLFQRFHHGARSQPQVGRLYLERETLLDATRDFCDVALGAQFEEGARYLAERTATHVQHLPLIAEIYPDARFIHIIRDGRDVARSIASQPWGAPTVAGAAAEWRSSVEAARDARLTPDRYREVRYESLLRGPRGEIATLFDWLGLDADDRVLAQAVAEADVPHNVDTHGYPEVGTGKWRKEFSRRDLDQFDGVAGDLLRELGYPAEEPLDAKAGGLTSLGARMRVLRLRVPRALRERERAPLTRSGSANRQKLADRALAAVLSSRSQELSELMAPNALVRVVSPRGDRALRGQAGRELLEHTLSNDRSLAGRQLVGDTHAADPTAGYVLSLQPDGSEAAADRAIFITVEGNRVRRLTIYQFPLRGA